MEANTSIAESPLRILIVDDDVGATESIQSLFAMQSYQTRSAWDGAEAIQVAHAFQPHLILLDITLAGIDGCQVAGALRATPGLEASTIVAITGYAHPIDLRRCAEADFDLHLFKPLDPDILEQLPVMLHAASVLIEQSRELQRRHTESLLNVVGAGIQMTNAFLDAAVNTRDQALKGRCLAKAERTRHRLVQLVQNMHLNVRI